MLGRRLWINERIGSVIRVSHPGATIFGSASSPYSGRMEINFQSIFSSDQTRWMTWWTALKRGTTSIAIYTLRLFGMASSKFKIKGSFLFLEPNTHAACGNSRLHIFVRLFKNQRP